MWDSRAILRICSMSNGRSCGNCCHVQPDAEHWERSIDVPLLTGFFKFSAAVMFSGSCPIIYPIGKPVTAFSSGGARVGHGDEFTTHCGSRLDSVTDTRNRPTRRSSKVRVSKRPKSVANEATPPLRESTAESDTSLSTCSASLRSGCASHECPELRWSGSSPAGAWSI
jgi:hypothetical protein